jgi:hypothetical protein
MSFLQPNYPSVRISLALHVLKEVISSIENATCNIDGELVKDSMDYIINHHNKNITNSQKEIIESAVKFAYGGDYGLAWSPQDDYMGDARWSVKKVCKKE